MAIDASDLARIETLFSEKSGEPGIAAEFRRLMPGLSLTRCDPSDIGCETPFRVFDKCELYLVDGTDHCWRLTDDPNRATGVVLVQTGGAS